MGALWSRGPDELNKKKKSVLAALYQKLKFLIASNWPKIGKLEVFMLGDPYYVRWIALQKTSRTKKRMTL